MHRPLNYMLEGHTPVPISAETDEGIVKWAQWFETANRHVAQTEFPNRVYLSTVFLGLDHSFLQEGPPLLFETMVFGGKLDGEMDRYSTWEEAEQGHAQFIERVQRAENAPPLQLNSNQPLIGD